MSIFLNGSRWKCSLSLPPSQLAWNFIIVGCIWLGNVVFFLSYHIFVQKTCTFDGRRKVIHQLVLIWLPKQCLADYARSITNPDWCRDLYTADIRFTSAFWFQSIHNLVTDVIRWTELKFNLVLRRGVWNFISRRLQNQIKYHSGPVSIPFLRCFRDYSTLSKSLSANLLITRMTTIFSIKIWT